MFGMVCALLALVALPPEQTAPPRERPATIRGRVTDAATGRPLAMARMRLTSTARGVPERWSRTDADGRYEFRELPAGRFTVTASKARFVTLQHGQHLPATAGRPIDVAAGAIIERVDLALPRSVAITGRVVDEVGDPVDGAWIRAARVRYVDGRRQLARIGSATANDAGEYRIAGLQPGTYVVVAAEDSEGFGREMDADIGFHQTAYPGVTSLAQAREVEVTAGRDTAGIDIALVPAPAARITGVVVGPNGAARPNFTILAQAVDDGPGGGLGAEVRTGPDGRFVFPRMIPGRYEFHARGKTETFEGAVLPVVVAGDADIVVPVSAGGRMRGRVTLPEGATIRPSDVRIGASPVGDTFVFGAGFGGVVKDDWTFDWDYLLGRRVVRASTLPSGWYVHSVRRGADDITDVPIVFKADEAIADLDIVLAADAATVSGTATDVDGKACDRCTVVLFADDSARWTYPSRFLHARTPDQNNAFTIESVVPERYLVAVFRDLETGAAMDPEFLERARGVATALDLSATKSAAVTLKVVKP